MFASTCFAYGITSCLFARHALNKFFLCQKEDLNQDISNGNGQNVFKMYPKNTPGQFYAVKAMPISTENRKNSKKEFDLLRLINSKYVVRAYGLTESEENSLTILELVQGGTLYQTSDKFQDDLINNFNFIEFAFKLILGVRSIHKVGFIHGSLTKSSVMVEKNEPKIIDLFSAVKLDTKEIIRKDCRYHDFSMQSAKKHLYTYAVDMYAIGVILFDLLEKVYSYPNCGETYPLKEGTVNFATPINYKILFLLYKLMATDANDRFTPCEALVYLNDIRAIDNIHHFQGLFSFKTGLTAEQIEYVPTQYHRLEKKTNLKNQVFLNIEVIIKGIKFAKIIQEMKYTSDERKENIDILADYKKAEITRLAKLKDGKIGTIV